MSHLITLIRQDILPTPRFTATLVNDTFDLTLDLTLPCCVHPLRLLGISIPFGIHLFGRWTYLVSCKQTGNSSLIPYLVAPGGSCRDFSSTQSLSRS